MKFGWRPNLPGAKRQITGIGEMAVGVAVFRRSQQNHIPVQGRQRPVIKRRWVGGSDRLKIIRNKDHTCNVVDTVKDKAWYSDLDISMAQPLALFGNLLYECLEDMDRELVRLKYFLDKDLAHHKRMARHGLDIEARYAVNHFVADALDRIHQKMDKQEAKAEGLVARMDRIFSGVS